MSSKTIFLNMTDEYDIGGKILKLADIQQAVIDAHYYRKELEALKKEVLK